MSKSDLLYGVKAIADYLNLREGQARHQIEEGRLPAFKMGGTFCATRSGLDQFLARSFQESASDALTNSPAAA